MNRKTAPAVHRVEQGESLASIAEEYGFFEATLWDLEENKSLRELRKRPAVLAEGDEVVIPELRRKSIAAATGRKHVFRRAGIPARYRLRLLREGEPVANAEFTLTIDGAAQTGTTDAEGTLDIPLPPGAREGELSVPVIGLRARVRFGLLDPITFDRGIQQRLINLGYLHGAGSGKLDARTRGAIASFQRAQGLTQSGTCDDATRTALEKAHEQPS